MIYIFLSRYKSLLEIYVKEQMAHNLATSDLTTEIEEAWETGKDFAFETNFDNKPMFWPDQFKARGYELFLIFICLESIDLANKRVAIRVENGGHFVPNFEVERRYNAGFKNLNSVYSQFDFVDILEGSAHGKMPKHIASIENGKVVFSSLECTYLQKLIPKLIIT
jgi:predicted ABC-type ATPase